MEPGGHGLHFVDPGEGEYSPGLQASQFVEEDEPGNLEVVPAGHSLQVT